MCQDHRNVSLSQVFEATDRQMMRITDVYVLWVSGCVYVGYMAAGRGWVTYVPLLPETPEGQGVIQGPRDIEQMLRPTVRASGVNACRSGGTVETTGGKPLQTAP